jgi:hypothetical protein
VGVAKSDRIQTELIDQYGTLELLLHARRSRCTFEVIAVRLARFLARSPTHRYPFPVLTMIGWILTVMTKKHQVQELRHDLGQTGQYSNRRRITLATRQSRTAADRKPPRAGRQRGYNPVKSKM